MWSRIAGLAGIALVVAACAGRESGTANVARSEAEQCVQSGGTWLASTEYCQPATGGGGGY
jgi:hypothetical protein